MTNRFQPHANYTTEHYEVMVEDNQSFHFDTGIPLLSVHKGWRRGNIHFFLGASGMGKSTLLRTLLVDALNLNNQKINIGVVLSEETAEQFLTEFNVTGKLTHYTKNIYFLPELDRPDIKTPQMWLSEVEKMVTENKIDILFYDNLTTSKLYTNMAVNEQGRYFLAMKALIKRLNVPFVCIGHTGTGINENFTGLIDGDHLRGNKTPLNVSEFFYVIQTVFVGETRHTVIRITKHRAQNPTHKFFKAFYYMNARMFGKFEPLDFEVFKEIFKGRNKL